MPLEQLPVDFLFTLDIAIAKPDPIPIVGAPEGDRLIVTAGEGRFEGPRLSGRVVPGPGSEWAYQRGDGSTKVDVRLLLETDDGASILMQYNGIGIKVDGTLQVRTAPLFQTGDERYAWLHQVQAVGLGSPAGRGITYDVYALR